MAYELKDGQGSLFINDKKEPGSMQPDRTGKLMINGQMYKVAGWLKKSANGTQFLSLKAELMEQPQPIPQRTATGNSYAAASGRQAPPQDDYGLDDEIQF
jgi:hypothetical protein